MLRGRGVRPFDFGLRCRGGFRMQHEVEGDLGERRVQGPGVDRGRIGQTPHFRDKTVPRGEREVIVQVEMPDELLTEQPEYPLVEPVSVAWNAGAMPTTG